jgi:AraC family transcriptional regulator
MLMNSPSTNVAPLFDRNAQRLGPAMLPLMEGRTSPRRRPDSRGNHQARRLHDRRPAERIDLAVEISPDDIVKRRAVTWDGMAAEIVQATRHEKIELRFRAPHHLLAVYEQGVRRDGETFVDGLPRSTLRDFKRKLTFVPAGHEYYEWQEPRSLARVGYFYVDRAKMPTHLETGVASTALAPRLFFADATLLDTALKLMRLMESESSDNRLYFEALGVVLAHELVRVNVGALGSEAPVRGGLAGWQQRIVTTYIEEHLAEQIPLATLARLVRLSPYHFCRAFKQSFGLPPHRYHSSRRIEEAKILLAKPAPSVTDVGLTVGFSEASSFTAAFRKATGLTPTTYHRSLT